MARRSARRHRGFTSKAQWRFAFSKAAPPALRRLARAKARATRGGKVVRYRRLPRRHGAHR